MTGAAPADGPRIVVIGSVNMDLVARVKRLPRAGQTVHGYDCREIPGGKGANEAVAAARLGARCQMIGRVGDDGFGRRLREELAAAGVLVDSVAVTENCSSGVAMICVEESGENTITVVAGANGALTPQDVEANEALIATADAVLLQLEIPQETVQAAVALAGRLGVMTILDPAPAPERVPEAMLQADVLCPNQSEAEAITGIAIRRGKDAELAAHWLQQRGVAMPIITLGAAGALLLDRDGRCHRVAAVKVDAVDSTAAGDAFAAALAVAIAEGQTIEQAVRFACAAGTIATTSFGAQPAMPGRAAVEDWLNHHT